MRKALVIDDEPHCGAMLANMIRGQFPELQLLPLCHSGAEGLKSITENGPDILFLDIEMPGMTGLQMLQQVPDDLWFSLIFTTGHQKYAIDAFGYGAIGYLLKPIEQTALQKAMQKALCNAKSSMHQIAKDLLQKITDADMPVGKIAIPTMEGFELVPAANIICCAAESNYTVLTLKQQEKMVVSRTLKDVEQMLAGHGFLRVHHSSLVNINEVHKYVRCDGGYLVMTDGTKVHLSRSRKELVLQKLIPKTL